MNVGKNKVFIYELNNSPNSTNSSFSYIKWSSAMPVFFCANPSYQYCKIKRIDFVSYSIRVASATFFSFIV